MEIETLEGKTYRIHVKGTISSIEDSDRIIETMKNAIEQDPEVEIDLIIEDSYIMLSRLIGNLLKLIKKDGKKVSLYAGENNLISLLSKLGLQEVFNVQKFVK